MVVFVSGQIVFKLKKARDGDGHYILVKRSIDQDDLTFLNIYPSNEGIAKFVEKPLRDLRKYFVYNSRGRLLPQLGPWTDQLDRI